MKSLCLHLEKMLGLSRKSDNFMDAFKHTCLYITRVMSAFEYQHTIKAYLKGKHSAKSLRLSLHANDYTSVRLKFFIFELARSKQRSDVLEDLRLEHSIASSDARRLLAILASTQTLSKVRQVVSQVEDISKTSCERQLLSLLPKVQSYIRHMTRSKLTFIVKSMNMAAQDMHSELTAKVLESYYAIMPTERSEAHMINYLKRCVHNHTINLIKRYTTSKHGRLVKVGTDSKGMHIFSLREVSDCQLPIAMVDEQQITHETLATPSTEELLSQQEQYDIKFSVKQILTRYQTRQRKYRYLNLLLGADDEEFTCWLRTHGKISRHKDNVEYQMMVSPEEFLDSVCKFLHIKQKQSNVFLLKLRHDLSGGEEPIKGVSYVPHTRAA